MSIKPVWIVLAADRDLVAVGREHPEVAREIEGLNVHGGDLFVLKLDEPAGSRARTQLILHADGGRLDLVGWEPEDVERLRRTSVYHYAHSVEGRSAALAARLVCALARHARLAVDKDLGGLLSGEEFCALQPDAQAAFLLGVGFGKEIDEDVLRAG